MAGAHGLALWVKSLKALVGAVPAANESVIPDELLPVGPVGWVIAEHQRLVIEEQGRSFDEKEWLAQLEADFKAKKQQQ
jgi:hypothetical protein